MFVTKHEDSHQGDEFSKEHVAVCKENVKADRLMVVAVNWHV